MVGGFLRAQGRSLEEGVDANEGYVAPPFYHVGGTYPLTFCFLVIAKFEHPSNFGEHVFTPH